MIRPTLFYHLQDFETEQALVQLEGAQTYNKLRSTDDLSWISQLEANRIDVAIIELPRLSREDYLALLESSAIADVEFIFSPMACRILTSINSCPNTRATISVSPSICRCCAKP